MEPNPMPDDQQTQTIATTTTTAGGTHVVTDVNGPGLVAGSMGIASIRLKDIMNASAMAAFIMLAFMMYFRMNSMQDRILDQQDAKGQSLEQHIATQIEISRQGIEASRQNIQATQENTGAIRRLEATVNRKGMPNHD
jgi:hypothetical protein